MAGQAERRRRRKEGLPPRPRLRWRRFTLHLPWPAYERFQAAHQAYVKLRGLKEEEYGEHDFAIHVIVKGAAFVIAAVEKQQHAGDLVQPATHIPPSMTQAADRLQALKTGRPA